MKIENKKIGIWGFGVTGRSILRYFSNQSNAGNVIEIFEQKTMTPEDRTLIIGSGASLAQYTEPIQFIENNDLIIASPGIDKGPYSQYCSKFISEVDLFSAHYKRPIVAITGTTGKTSITHLLGQLCMIAGLKTNVGGNIGTGMLDLLTHDHADLCILELSSFQLEYATQFAPHLAIITNLYNNHLDRHQTIERYFEAKSHIMTQQNNDQIALLPLTLLSQCNTIQSNNKRYFFSWDEPTAETYAQLKNDDGLFFTRDSAMIFKQYDNGTIIFSLDDLPPLSLQENWLIIISALHLLNIPLSIIKTNAHLLTIPPHRLERVTSKHGITFYNDSKSTTPEATLAAVQALQGYPMHLFLGGLSKGIDRAPLIEQLKNKVQYIYCFGKEAEHLHMLCAQTGIPAFASPTLEDAFTLCMQHTKPGDHVLLSPAGASYDLFKDYQDRGDKFKKMVMSY